MMKVIINHNMERMANLVSVRVGTLWKDCYKIILHQIWWLTGLPHQYKHKVNTCGLKQNVLTALMEPLTPFYEYYVSTRKKLGVY